LVAETHSVAETTQLAVALAAELHEGDALCLFGDLGAGKTTFVKGVLSALGADERIVTSPTFTLENRYPLSGSRGIALAVHADLYRMEGRVEEDLCASLLEAREEGALILVEWAEALSEYLAPCYNLRLTLAPGALAKSTTRMLELSHTKDELAPGLVSAWRGERGT
jgi:tRNA threonylcarbamoyladenosine biosynthesis protein TsaE